MEIGYFLDNPNTPNILIGRFCSLADKIYFSIGGNHPYKNVSSFPFDSASVVTNLFGDNKAATTCIRPNHFQIIIGHDVWIGYGATILGGIKIGNGAVIGANAVVAKDVPPYAIAVGNPARVIKYRFDAKTVKKILAVKWWNWSLKKITDNLPLMVDVEKFLAAHYTPALAETPEDDIGRQLKAIRGELVFISLLPIFAPRNRCGLGSCAAFANRTSRTRCLSFGSAKTQPNMILNFWRKLFNSTTTARQNILSLPKRKAA